MTPREELLQIQKVISDNLKEGIKAYQSRSSKTFKKYLKDYSKEFKNYDSITNKSNLINEIIKSHIVYIGDYHTLDQSQRTVIKILRELIDQNRPITLALEMVNLEDQRHLNSFIKGKITEKQFLQSIDYYKNWGFPWRNYKPIFDFAKINKIKLLGLNCKARKEKDLLKKRDVVAAKRIVAETKKYPNNIILVLYGDLHVAERHLPKRTKELLSKNNINRSQIIIYQNSEDLYWNLVKDGKEQSTDVVKIKSGKYCIMNTPPWIKLQTYLNWLERGGDLLLSPKGTWSDEGYEQIDYYHQIVNYQNTIASFFNLSKKGFELHLYTAEEIEFIDFINNYMKSRANLSLKEIELIRGEVFFYGICLIPGENVIYLSTLNINKIAEKSSQLLGFKVSKYFPKLGREGDRDFFYSKILFEALGYLGSKVINFKRKCDRLSDYKKIIKQTKSKKLKGQLKDQKIIAKLLIEHKTLESSLIKYKSKLRLPNPQKSIYRQPPRVFLGLTKALGCILGDKLFLALMNRSIDKTYLRKIFLYKPIKGGDSFRKYMELVSIVGKLKEKYKSKTERF